MMAKSPERVQKQYLKTTSSLVNSFQVNGEKRLKSLDSRTSIQNRHLYSYQLYQSKQGNQQITNSQVQGEKDRRYGSEGGHMIESLQLGQREQTLGNNYSKKRQKKNQTMQVFVRVRPLNTKELSGKNGNRKIIQVADDRKFVIINSSEGNKSVFSQTVRDDRLFEMNRAFGEECSNEEVFDYVMKEDIKQSLFEGFNCTCFVYGMTGAGKTYTMFGDICNYLTMNSPIKGLIMLSLKEIIESMKEKKQNLEEDYIPSKRTDTYGDNNQELSEENRFSPNHQQKKVSFRLKLSYLEIYNEQIHDLLSLDSQNNDNLMVIEDPSRGVFVPELIEQEIVTEQQVLECIRIGNTRRQMASTGQNEFSSRSHAIITFTLEQTITNKNQESDQQQSKGDNINGNKYTVLTSKLCLVDLAGSERAAVTENKGLRLQEGANINKSLLALGNCINILSDTTKKGAFVPYRDSKLTRLLKDSLGGNTQTYMIACVSPAFISLEETLNTLKYAQRASRIQKVVTKNEKTIQGLSSQKSLQYITMIENMKKEIDFLKQQLASTVQANNDNQMPNNSNFTCESQLNQHAQEVGGLYLLKEKSSNQVSSASELFSSNVNPPNSFPANIELNSIANVEIKRSQIISNGVPQLLLQKQDSTTSAMIQQMGGWQDNDSFSSSGKSVRISCTNTSNNGSVILFKRSPSQLNFTKQQQIHQQKVTEEMNQLCGKILKNLEENWEIQQSIQDLNNLKKQNEEVLDEKQQRLKKLKGNLIQWPHESEINQLQIGIGQLQNTMANNQNILENMQQALRRNVENKQELSLQMVQVLQSSSEQLVKTMNQTCQVLQIEKNDLENANLDLKQQHLHFQTKFQEKVHQIKSMEEQIKQMQKELQEKDQIIQQNQQVIMHLANNSSQVNSQNIPSALVSGNQINQSMMQTFVSKQNVGGAQNPNSVFNPFSSQPSMTSCPFNQTSFFLTNVTNNGNQVNSFNPFLSQADQNSQNQYKDQVEGNNVAESKCSVTQPIKNISSKNNQIPKSDSIKQDAPVNNFTQNQSTIVQKTTTGNKNSSHSATSAPFYCNSSAIYLTNASNTSNQKHKEAKRFVSSDANPNNSVSKLQIQMQSSINASFSQSTALRSTSSQNTNNKKFFTEKNGYFDFKNKQYQISSGQSSSASSSLAVTSSSSGGITNFQSQKSTTQTTSNLNSKNATQAAQNTMMTSQTGLQKQTPGSPQMRVQSPNQAGKNTNNNINNNQEIPKTQSSNGSTIANSSATAIQNTQNQNLMGSKNLMTSTSQMTASNNYQNFSSPTQSSARLSTVYKSPSSIAQSIINRKSVLTHREKQAQGVKNNSSGAVGALSSFPNNTSSINQALTITQNQVQSKTNSASTSNSNNNNQSNSIAKLGLQSTIPSSNNVSQLNSQNNNISLYTNNNNNSSNNSNNPQLANKLQDARNEYKEFINIFRKIQKDDEEPSQIQNATIVNSTQDEKTKSSNNNNKPSNEYDLFPNASQAYRSNEGNNYNEQSNKLTENQQNQKQNLLNESPQQQSEILNNKIKNILSSEQRKGNNPDISLVDFLQTDEFPEIYQQNKNQGNEKRQSLERTNSNNKNNSLNSHINNLLSSKKSSELQNKEVSPSQAVQEIIQTPFLTVSSLHQKPHSLPPQQNISQLYNTTTISKPSHQNINSQGQSSSSYLTLQQNHSTPSSSSLSKFTINLASNSSQRRNESITRGIQQYASQKDSKIATPENSLIAQKIDHKEKSTINQFQSNQEYSSSIYGVQEKQTQDMSSSQVQKSNINIYQEIRRLDSIVQANNVNQDTLKDIKELVQRLDSSQFQRFILSQSDQASVEKLKKLLEEQNFKSERFNQSAPSHGMIQSHLSLSQQRIKSFGLPSKSLLEKENNNNNQNKYQSLSPNKKVNHLVQDVIDKQKKKRSEEFQRHLMLSNLASNIFNSDSDIDLMQTQVQNQNQNESPSTENIQNQKLSSPTNQNRKISTGITSSSIQSNQNGYSSGNAQSNVISINLYQNKNILNNLNGYNSTESVTASQSNYSQIQTSQVNQQYSSLNSQYYSGQNQIISPNIPNTQNNKLNSTLASSQAVAQLNSTPIAQLNLTSPQPQQITYGYSTSSINQGGNQQENLTNNIYKPSQQYA